MTTLAGKDILRTEDLTHDEIELVLSQAESFERALASGEPPRLMERQVLATLFYEPSTRTRLSFETAMLRLGGSVLSVAEARTSSSAAKGETLYDTGKMIESYADVAVIRHPERGSAQELADGAAIPVLNAGDGTGQHPTQALLDLYTIRKEKGARDDLSVALVGDLKNGRTVHSLVMLLANYGYRFYFVAPPALAMPTEITAALAERRVPFSELTDLRQAVADSDVLYVTRIQKERFTDTNEYLRLKGSYVVDNALLSHSKRDILVMHPLPRVDEIAREVDAYNGAAYFRQAANGVPIRMALLALVTGRV